MICSESVDRRMGLSYRGMQLGIYVECHVARSNIPTLTSIVRSMFAGWTRGGEYVEIAFRTMRSLSSA